jgi:hypothetical protein
MLGPQNGHDPFSLFSPFSTAEQGNASVVSNIERQATGCLFTAKLLAVYVNGETV